MEESDSTDPLLKELSVLEGKTNTPSVLHRVTDCVIAYLLLTAQYRYCGSSETSTIDEKWPGKKDHGELETKLI